MNEFDRHWQECLNRARQAPPRLDEAPFGFATRVLAATVTPAGRGSSLVGVWERLGLRALAGMLAALLVLGALEYRDRPASGLARPGIEHLVAQVFWML